jgi:hypothetical protein
LTMSHLSPMILPGNLGVGEEEESSLLGQSQMLSMLI